VQTGLTNASSRRGKALDHERIRDQGIDDIWQWNRSPPCGQAGTLL
jgi:hypothetical protein